MSIPKFVLAGLVCLVCLAGLGGCRKPAQPPTPTAQISAPTALPAERGAGPAAEA